MMLDGRMGIAPHHSDTHAIVDAYHGNECEQLHVPFTDLMRLPGSGALVQTKPTPMQPVSGERINCPACPDGYWWTTDGPTAQACPVCSGRAWVVAS